MPALFQTRISKSRRRSIFGFLGTPRSRWETFPGVEAPGKWISLWPSTFDSQSSVAVNRALNCWACSFCLGSTRQWNLRYELELQAPKLGWREKVFLGQIFETSVLWERRNVCGWTSSGVAKHFVFLIYRQLHCSFRNDQYLEFLSDSLKLLNELVRERTAWALNCRVETIFARPSAHILNTCPILGKLDSSRNVRNKIAYQVFANMI